MAEIRVLDPHVADLIAAGEVVERTPAGQGPAGDPQGISILGGSEFRLRKFSACGCEFTAQKRRPTVWGPVGPAGN